MPSLPSAALGGQRCPLCKQTFTPHRVNQVYCTTEHRIEFNRLTHITVKVPFNPNAFQPQGETSIGLGTPVVDNSANTNQTNQS